MIIIDIIVFIFILGIIILVHEFGHFFVAKKAGILCHEFAIGMGPVLYQKKKGETVYSLRAIPIGGFVSMAGEEVSQHLSLVGQEIGLNIEDDLVTELILSSNMQAMIMGRVVEIDLYGEHGGDLIVEMDNGKTYQVSREAFYIFENGKKMQITPYDRCFDSKPLWQRFLTIAAGPLMNFVLAIVVFLIYWTISGVPNYSSTVISKVSENYPANGVLVKGDEILSIEGTKIDRWTDISDIFLDLASQGKTSVVLGIMRDGEEITLEVPTYLIINSVALSNIQIEEKYIYKNESDWPVSSRIQVGNVAHNYVGTPAKDEVRMANGDIITAIKVDPVGKTTSSFQEVETWPEIINILDATDVANITFRFYSQSEEKVIESKTAIQSYGNELLRNQRINKFDLRVGISPETHFSFVGVITHSFTSFGTDFTMIFRTLKILVNPSGVRQVGISNLSGVVGIFDMVRSYRSVGFLSLLTFVCFLSVNLGVVNLLPIPALDGGRIVFLGYELVTRRKVNKKVEATLNNVMFVLLMILMLYVTFNDIGRLFRK